MQRSHFSFLSSVVAVLVTTWLAPVVAKADEASAHTVPVTVLALDTDDVDENADALTSALRSQVRAAPGWALKDTSQSLGLLTAALKCTSRPNAECQDRIADQIKADRYIWGLVTKGPGGDQVTAEIHLYQRGKEETSNRQSYASNLKDANDDTLREVAKGIIRKLGVRFVGAVVVQAGEADGEVIVDGDKRFPLKQGQARIEIPEGSHSIEIDAPSIAPTKRNVLVTAGKETTVNVTSAVVEPPAEEKKNGSSRKILGGVVLGAGVILEAVAVQQGMLYLDLKDRGRDYAQYVPANKTPCETNVDSHFCELDNRARTSSALFWVFGGVGLVGIGAGTYLLLTSGSSDEGEKVGSVKRPHVTPMISKEATGLMMSGSF